MRCYCSICRKTAGGGGFAINIMGQAKTLKVEGMTHVKIYRATLGKTKQGKPKLSSARRHFCRECASCLWIFDPHWKQWVYPFASAINTPLPKPPERVHLLLNSAASWCQIPSGKHDLHFTEFPEESIEQWHKRHHLLR
jgi:hypothetical protein